MIRRAVACPTPDQRHSHRPPAAGGAVRPRRGWRVIIAGDKRSVGAMTAMGSEKHTTAHLHSPLPSSAGQRRRAGASEGADSPSPPPECHRSAEYLPVGHICLTRACWTHCRLSHQPVERCRGGSPASPYLRRSATRQPEGFQNEALRIEAHANRSRWIRPGGGVFARGRLMEADRRRGVTPPPPTAADNQPPAPAPSSDTAHQSQPEHTQQPRVPNQRSARGGQRRRLTHGESLFGPLQLADLVVDLAVQDGAVALDDADIGRPDTETLLLGRRWNKERGTSVPARVSVRGGR